MNPRKNWTCQIKTLYRARMNFLIIFFFDENAQKQPFAFQIADHLDFIYLEIARFFQKSKFAVFRRKKPIAKIPKKLFRFFLNLFGLKSKSP
jgi:hypothetical protein